jgi:hypothetical protein
MTVLLPTGNGKAKSTPCTAHLLRELAYEQQVNGQSWAQRWWKRSRLAMRPARLCCPGKSVPDTDRISTGEESACSLKRTVSRFKR